MRLVHLSDLHLGYRQYQRLTPGGVNQREADVASTFRTAMDRVIAIAPDVIVIAGDVFHSVRPPNHAILHAFLQFTRLRATLPNAIVVLIAGNHDTPRSSETGGILQLFAQLGIHVVDREAKRLAFPERELAILCVPDVPGIVMPSLRPDSDARFNVLAVHGDVPGMLPENLAIIDPAAVHIQRHELVAAKWDYVALGHYHVYRQIAPRAYYSGSIEYTSVDTWGELREQGDAKIKGKGFIEQNLETSEHTFHELPPARPLVELPMLRANADMTPAEADARIRAAVEACIGGIDDKIVRLFVRDIPRNVSRELDHKAIREYKRRALSFNLDLRPPEIRSIRSAGGAPGRRPSLAEMVRDHLTARPLVADLDRDVFVARGLAYLENAQTSVAPSAMSDANAAQ